MLEGRGKGGGGKDGWMARKAAILRSLIWEHVQLSIRTYCRVHKPRIRSVIANHMRNLSGSKSKSKNPVPKIPLIRNNRNDASQCGRFRVQ